MTDDLEARIRAAQPVLWCNPDDARAPVDTVDTGERRFTAADVQGAMARLRRFAPLLARLFPELQPAAGAIESPVLPAAPLAAAMGWPAAGGALWVKADHGLPVAGSIKARGGIHEVLEVAEDIALRHGLVRQDGDYAALAGPAARAVFARHGIAVGSTGNLGLSIGVMAAALGFQATVHMSADAKPWKKERLRARGVQVVEHGGDYERAVAAGRAEAASRPGHHFVDDERSASLLLGYAAAAEPLSRQLRAAGVRVDADHPLLVYLPCGVGGAPAGILLGLKLAYGPHVHVFFAEPVQSPCMLVLMRAAEGAHPSVYDLGLTNQTEADGLAVPRGSLLARAVARTLLAGVFTVTDDQMFRLLHRAHRHAGLRLEPSAAAGFVGPAMLRATPQGRAYLERHALAQRLPQATHLVWTTGGLFVPDAQFDAFLARGAALDATAPPDWPAPAATA